MKYALKIAKPVTVYRLGDQSDAEKQLIEEGAIRVLPNGKYELFSQESINGHGQIAKAGDYFKVDLVDQKHFPYPNDKEGFEATHRHIEGDLYEQICQPLPFWQKGDPISDAVQYLIDHKLLTLREDDPSHYFNAFLWGTDLSAPENASLVFYEITRDEQGVITNVNFNFVDADYFRENYKVLQSQ